MVKADERSGTSQEALTMGASAVGCARRAAISERINGVRMMEEQVIQTKRGLYGRVNITLPLPVKTSLMDLQKRSGLRKAEFLRVALMIGTVKISENVLYISKKELGGDLAQAPART
jgi:hypothetical protein